MHVNAQDESIHIALDSNSDSFEDSNPPLPQSRAKVKSEKSAHFKRNARSKRNPKGCSVIIKHKTR